MIPITHYSRAKSSCDVPYLKATLYRGLSSRKKKFLATVGVQCELDRSNFGQRVVSHAHLDKRGAKIR